jgi:hypothetical protein
MTKHTDPPSYNELVDQYLGTDQCSELRRLLMVLLDFYCLDHAIAPYDWAQACLLAGRYCEPFLSRCPAQDEPSLPAAPSDEELKQILDLGMKWYGSGRDYTMEDFCRDARALLARLSTTPTSIPFGERLPEEGDCDIKGRCWLGMPDHGTDPSWTLTTPRNVNRYHSHWRPFHALPLPAAPGEQAS